MSEYVNVGREEAVGIQKYALAQLDKPGLRSDRPAPRKDPNLEDRKDIMSMLMRARDEDGEAMTDRELRDELITLLLAGHETTANSLAWAWERLVRTPDAYNELYDAVRTDRADKADQIEYVIQETMRSRPVIPMVGRRVMAPWQLGEYGVEAGTPISMSIFLVHHREDLYPEPWEFKPQRWVGHKPGTYEWIPVRRRHASLPRRVAGDGRDARRARAHGRAPRDRARPPRGRTRAAPQRHDDPRPRRPSNHHPQRLKPRTLRRYLHATCGTKCHRLAGIYGNRCRFGSR